MVWLIPVLLTVHNGEEAVGFTRMRAHAASLPDWLGALQSRISSAALLWTLGILSALAFVLAGLVLLRPRDQAALWLLLALEAAVAINVVAHVASAAVIFRGYGPGLATAVLVNAPFAAYVFGRVRREEWVSAGARRLLPVGGLVLHGPVLAIALWLVASRAG